MKFGWTKITGNGAFISHTLEICEEPNRKSKKKWVDIKNYGDAYTIIVEKCPTGWFFVKDFYGHSGYVRQNHKMEILKDDEPSSLSVYLNTPKQSDTTSYNDSVVQLVADALMDIDPDRVDGGSKNCPKNVTVDGTEIIFSSGEKSYQLSVVELITTDKNVE